MVAPIPEPNENDIRDDVVTWLIGYIITCNRNYVTVCTMMSCMIALRKGDKDG
jgi:hypothetical protein